MINSILKKGEYFDSVSLMFIAKKISEIEAVTDSAVVMGTKENKSMLQSAGLITDELKSADDMDLMIAFQYGSAEESDIILGKINELLKQSKESKTTGETLNPMSIESAVQQLPGANMAMISVAGRYAGHEAMKALRNGLHVMLFSDNVTIEQEIELKKYARDKGLFVMGPDCGTAIINGVPLAFANVVTRGNIGIVAASGTGLQEVTTIISNNGGGITQAIGTGGRDVKKDVGGIMFIEGIKALAGDPQTEVILLVSKPPADEVVMKINELVDTIDKPVVALFLNASKDLLRKTKIRLAQTLEEAALIAVAYSQKKNPDEVTAKLKNRSVGLNDLAKQLSGKLRKEQKYLRALFSGGTFCDETQMFFQNIKEPVYSNTPVGNVKKIKDIWKSEKHTIIDLGDDDFTVGKPHPMIDYSTRNKRILTEADDPETAVILLDVVIGYGSNMNPLAELVPVIKEVRNISKQQGKHIPVIASVTGTDKDPQNRAVVKAGLEAEGVVVMESNAAASELAGLIIELKIN